MDKRLEMRCKIDAVFEHYAKQSDYYRRANVVQRLVMEDSKHLIVGNRNDRNRPREEQPSLYPSRSPLAGFYQSRAVTIGG